MAAFDSVPKTACPLIIFEMIALSLHLELGAMSHLLVFFFPSPGTEARTLHTLGNVLPLSYIPALIFKKGF